jgi:hypothetical protein
MSSELQQDANSSTATKYTTVSAYAQALTVYQFRYCLRPRQLVQASSAARSPTWAAQKIAAPHSGERPSAASFLRRPASCSAISLVSCKQQAAELLQQQIATAASQKSQQMPAAQQSAWCPACSSSSACIASPWAHMHLNNTCSTVIC